MLSSHIVSTPELVPALWSFFVRLGVFFVLEGACARLAERNALTGRGNGAELLLGLLAMVAVPLWPAVAALGARAVLDGRDPRWRLARALFRSLRACACVLPYLGAPLAALMLAAPWHAPRLAALGVAYLLVAAALGCLLARGAAPRGAPAAQRFVTRFGAGFALCAIFALRAWQPELTLTPLFEQGSQLVFPFEKNRPPPPPPPPRPRHPVPPLAPTERALGTMLAMATVALIGAAFTWRRPPAEAPVAQAEAAPADIWPTVIAFAGALGVLVLDVGLLPTLAPRPRAFTFAATEALLLGALALALPELLRKCGALAFGTAAGALTCMAAAAVLGLEEVWVHHVPTTFALLFSVLAFAALGTSAARVLESSVEAPVAWAAWLAGASLLTGALVLTDALYLKIELHQVPWVREIFMLCWLVTKATLTALILFVALMLPDWVKPTLLPSAPASAPTPAA